MESVEIGVIGGVGLYQIPDITNKTSYRIETPFGKPSDNIIVGTLRGKKVAFIARHGEHHTLPPSKVPYRANIYAFKLLGVQTLISVNACGSLRAELEPGHFVVPDQLVDQTRLERGHTFFDEELVVHTSTAEPFCNQLRLILGKAVAQADATVHSGGTFVTIEGPRFSTRAESQHYKQLGYSIIGMTTSPEAYLAREAEMHYASLAYVTDYDSWNVDIEPVNTCGLENVMERRARLAQVAVANAVDRLDTAPECDCQTALDHAILTDLSVVPSEILKRLQPILQRRMAIT